MNTIVKAEDKEMQKYGISLEEAGMLFVAEAIGKNANPAEIARWHLREHHSVSDLLKRMNKKGLVNLDKDLERKNMIRVSLTPKGREAFLIWKNARARHEITSVLSEEERQQLTVCLEKLRDAALSRLSIDYKPPFP